MTWEQNLTTSSAVEEFAFLQMRWHFSRWVLSQTVPQTKRPTTKRLTSIYRYASTLCDTLTEHEMPFRQMLCPATASKRSTSFYVLAVALNWALANCGWKQRAEVSRVICTKPLVKLIKENRRKGAHKEQKSICE
jgi:hypothetical protein